MAPRNISSQSDYGTSKNPTLGRELYVYTAVNGPSIVPASYAPANNTGTTGTIPHTATLANHIGAERFSQAAERTDPVKSTNVVAV